MKRYLPITALLVLLASLRGGAQLPQITCCNGGGAAAGGLSQGSGTTIADEQIVRGDTSGLQGSTLSISDGGLLRFGGTTSSFPAIKNVGTNLLMFRLADDSAMANATMGGFTTSGDVRIGGLNTSTGANGNTVIYGNSNSSSAFMSVFASSGTPCYKFTGATNAENSIDLGMCRASAAGVVAFGNGTAGDTSAFYRYGGSCTVASDQTNATTTMQTAACFNKTTGSVAITLAAGRSYAGQCILRLSDSVAADGADLDFGGGTATATDFWAAFTAFDTALNFASIKTSLTTAGSATTFTGSGYFEVHLRFLVNAGGTFQPRFAQHGHTTGTLTLAAGSFCLLTDVTP